MSNLNPNAEYGDILNRIYNLQHPPGNGAEDAASSEEENIDLELSQIANFDLQQSLNRLQQLQQDERERGSNLVDNMTNFEVNHLKQRNQSLQARNKQLKKSMAKAKEMKDKILKEMSQITKKYETEVNDVRLENHKLRRENEKYKDQIESIGYEPTLVRVANGKILKVDKDKKKNASNDEDTKKLKNKNKELKEKGDKYKEQRDKMKKLTEELNEELRKRDDYWKEHVKQVHEYNQHTYQVKITALYDEIEKLKKNYAQEINEHQVVMKALDEKLRKVMDEKEKLVSIHKETLQLANEQENEIETMKDSTKTNDGKIKKLEKKIKGTKSYWKKMAKILDIKKMTDQTITEKDCYDKLVQYKKKLYQLHTLILMYEEDINSRFTPGRLTQTQILEQIEKQEEKPNLISIPKMMIKLEAIMNRWYEAANGNKDLVKGMDEKVKDIKKLKEDQVKNLAQLKKDKENLTKKVQKQDDKIVLLRNEMKELRFKHVKEIEEIVGEKFDVVRAKKDHLIDKERAVVKKQEDEMKDLILGMEKMKVKLKEREGVERLLNHKLEESETLLNNKKMEMNNLKMEHQKEQVKFMQHLKEQQQFVTEQEREQKSLLKEMSSYAQSGQYVREQKMRNGQLEEENRNLQAQLEGLMQNQMAATQEKNKALGEKSALQGQVGALVQQLRDHEQQVKELYNQLNGVTEKQQLSIGASERVKERCRVYEDLLLSQINLIEFNINNIDDTNRVSNIKDGFLQTINKRKENYDDLLTKYNDVKVEFTKCAELVEKLQFRNQDLLNKNVTAVTTQPEELEVLKKEINILEDQFIKECEQYENKLKLKDHKIKNITKQLQNSLTPEERNRLLRHRPSPKEKNGGQNTHHEEMLVEKEKLDFANERAQSQIDHLKRQLDSKLRMLRISDTKVSDLEEKLARYKSMSKLTQGKETQSKLYRKRIIQCVQQFVIHFHKMNTDFMASIGKYATNYDGISDIVQSRVMKLLDKHSSLLSKTQRSIEEGHEIYHKIESIIRDFLNDDAAILEQLDPFEKLQTLHGDILSFSPKTIQTEIRSEWKKQLLIYQATIDFINKALRERDDTVEKFYKSIQDLLP